MTIPFNKPYITGEEINYINKAILSGHLAAGGEFTVKCQEWFRGAYGFKNCVLTTSCTDAIEMAALLLEIQPGDEIIIPSYTFVSTALAFYREGAKIVFADSRDDNPCINENKLESLVTGRTRAIVVVHYAGVACYMSEILEVARKYNLAVIEDCAHAINSFYLDKPLGTQGNLACFSFHETKNIHCGEGGMLVINDERFIPRAWNIRDKGTNRTQFDKGLINYYEWVDTGSSFALSEINAAFLLGQIECLEDIQKKRLRIWEFYNSSLKDLHDKELLKLPFIPSYASNNGNMFYLICRSEQERNDLIEYLIEKKIRASFHYRCLHSSKLMKAVNGHQDIKREMAIKYQDRLLRLPFYTNMPLEMCDEVIRCIKTFYFQSRNSGGHNNFRPAGRNN